MSAMAVGMVRVIKNNPTLAPFPYSFYNTWLTVIICNNSVKGTSSNAKKH